jgi:hypothetical protein
MLLPGFDSVRVPARFGTLLALALSVLVAFAVRRLCATRAVPAWFPAAAVALVLADGAATVPAVPLPPAVPAEQWAVDAVLEIPLDTYRDAAAMAGSFRHGLPSINGYSGYGPPHYAIVQSAIREGRMSVLDELRRFGRLAVVVDETTNEGRVWMPLLEAFRRPDLSAPGNRKVFVLPRATGPNTCLSSAQAAGLTYAGISAVGPLLPGANSNEMALALDGDVTTFHTVSESTAAGQGVAAILDRERTVSGIVLWLGPVPDDHPGFVRVVLRAGSGEITAFEGDVAGSALAGALADPLRVPLAICFPPTATRDVLVIAPVTTRRPWNVAEISVIAPR